MKGEVIGVNTLALSKDQNLNFAVGAEHIEVLLTDATDAVRPLSQLPQSAFQKRVAEAKQRNQQADEQWKAEQARRAAIENKAILSFRRRRSGNSIV